MQIQSEIQCRARRKNASHFSETDHPRTAHHLTIIFLQRLDHSAASQQPSHAIFAIHAATVHLYANTCDHWGSERHIYAQCANICTCKHRHALPHEYRPTASEFYLHSSRVYSDQ